MSLLFTTSCLLPLYSQNKSKNNSNLGIALKCLASGVIIAHTHPSGELSPSRSDLEITVPLQEAAKLMQIALLDHLIITVEGYISFSEEGLIVKPG